MTRGGKPIASPVFRIARHLWVLGVAAALVFVVSRPPAPGPPPALRNLAAMQINAVVQTGAGATLEVSRPTQTLVVRAGQTVEMIAAQYGASANAIRWANGLIGGAEPAPGTSLLVPTGAGALVKVLPGETPTQFAARLHLDPATVLDDNALTSNAPLATGRYLLVPLGHAPAGALIARYFSVANGDVPSVPLPPVRTDGYPYGQCTYYVASLRNVTWPGNAIDWWWNAAGHRPEGHVPVEGAIAVFDSGWLGHVAFVEHVNADGTFVVSEMNNYVNGGGWGRVDHRVVSDNDPWLIGFIY